jgi:hypothetical protein
VKRRASSILKQQRDIGPSPSVVVAVNNNHGSIEDPTSATSHHDSLGSTHSHNEHVSSSSSSNLSKPIDDKDSSTSHQNSFNSSVPIAPPPPLPATARAVSDNESALQLALEASRREAEALKLAVRHSTDRYQDLKESHDALLEQLKEDVSSPHRINPIRSLSPPLFCPIIVYSLLSDHCLLFSSIRSLSPPPLFYPIIVSSSFLSDHCLLLSSI